MAHSTYAYKQMIMQTYTNNIWYAVKNTNKKKLISVNYFSSNSGQHRHMKYLKILTIIVKKGQMLPYLTNNMQQHWFHYVDVFVYLFIQMSKYMFLIEY